MESPLLPRKARTTLAPLWWALLLALSLPNPTNATSSDVPITIAIVDDSSSCTAMKLTESNMAVTCSGSGDGTAGCHAGDLAAITGNLLVSNTIYDNPTVVLTLCLSVMGVVMHSMCSEPIEAGYLCDWYNYDYNGGECGAIGSGFAISANATAPDEVEKIYELRESMFGSLLGVGVHIGVSFANEYCGNQQQAEEEAYNMTYVGAGVVFAIGALSLFNRRKRRIATDEDENGQNFVEMKDTHAIAVV